MQSLPTGRVSRRALGSWRRAVPGHEILRVGAPRLPSVAARGPRWKKAVHVALVGCAMSIADP
jgi:hypothetical protein